MRNLLLTTAIVAAGATTALAQATPENVFTAEADPQAVRASDFIGMRVYASENEVADPGYEGLQTGWEDLGEVNDVILSRDGEVQSVLVDIGGFLGIGERQVAIDMDAIKFVSDDATDADDYFLVMTADRATIEGAPEYSMGADMEGDAAQTDTAAVDPDAAATESSDVAATEQPMTEEADTTAQAEDPAQTDPAMDESQTAETDPAMDQPADDTQAADADTATETPPAVDPDVADTDMNADVDTDTAMTDAGTDTEMMRDGYTTAQSDRITAENLTGARVYDANDEWIGEVSMFLLGEGGQSNQAVVDVGGFLGIGEKPVALDINELDVLQQDDGDELRIYVSMTKDQLEEMPTYEK